MKKLTDDYPYTVMFTDERDSKQFKDVVPLSNGWIRCNGENDPMLVDADRTYSCFPPQVIAEVVFMVAEKNGAEESVDE